MTCRIFCRGGRGRDICECGWQRLLPVREIADKGRVSCRYERYNR